MSAARTTCCGYFARIEMGGERWDPCIVHRDDAVDVFFADYFGRSDRNVLLIAGAGFDPRSRVGTARLSEAAASMRALLFREHRPNPTRNQSDRAERNTTDLITMLTMRRAEYQVEQIEIFASDGAVVGGRNVVNFLSGQNLEVLTDVVVDVSALSAGTSFPIIRYFIEHVCRNRAPGNLHVLVVHDSSVDAGIQSIASDTPGYVHGFKGLKTLSHTADAARLWLPQLAAGRRASLQRLYDFIRPHDTCPIFPFPAGDPRLGDVLAEEYLTELEDAWSVDTRNLVYANEGDPLDLYRTVLRLDDLRRPVFEGTGGSMLILSPLGGKVMAFGALMAALERDLPIAYVEPFGYELKDTVPEKIENPNLMHIWLEGDVYPQPRPILRHAGSATE